MITMVGVLLLTKNYEEVKEKRHSVSAVRRAFTFHISRGDSGGGGGGGGGGPGGQSNLKWRCRVMFGACIHRTAGRFSHSASSAVGIRSLPGGCCCLCTSGGCAAAAVVVCGLCGAVLLSAWLGLQSIVLMLRRWRTCRGRARTARTILNARRCCHRRAHEPTGCTVGHSTYQHDASLYCSAFLLSSSASFDNLDI